MLEDLQRMDSWHLEQLIRGWYGTLPGDNYILQMFQMLPGLCYLIFIPLNGMRSYSEYLIYPLQCFRKSGLRAKYMGKLRDSLPLQYQSQELPVISRQLFSDRCASNREWLKILTEQVVL